MKKHLYKLTAIAAALTLTMTQSCKKDDDAQSREELLIGTWNGYQSGIDSNNNGVWDQSERQDIPANRNSQFTFNAGGTGLLKGDTTLAGLPMNWNFTNNDLRIVVDLGNAQRDSLDFSVITISESEMLLKSLQTTPAVFASMRKR